MLLPSVSCVREYLASMPQTGSWLWRTWGWSYSTSLLGWRWYNKYWHCYRYDFLFLGRSASASWQMQWHKNSSRRICRMFSRQGARVKYVLLFKCSSKQYIFLVCQSEFSWDISELRGLHHMTSHHMTWNDISQWYHVTNQPHYVISKVVTMHIHATAEGSFAHKTWFGHRTAWLPFAHSVWHIFFGTVKDSQETCVAKGRNC